MSGLNPVPFDLRVVLNGGGWSGDQPLEIPTDEEIAPFLLTGDPLDMLLLRRIEES